MRHFTNILFFLFLSTYGAWGQGYEVNSWQEIKENKKGKVVVLFHTIPPFISEEVGIGIKGFEHELLKAFFEFTERKNQVKIDVEWKKVNVFTEIFDKINKSESGVFGTSSISITPQRMTKVGFSPAYMPDIEVIVSSQNLTILESLDEFQQVFDTLTVLNVPESTFSENIDHLRSEYLPNIKVKNVNNIDDILNTLSTEDNYFSYVHLPIYALALRDGLPVKRQKFFQVKRQGYAFVFPKESDWIEPVNAFFTSEEYKEIRKKILTESLGSQIIDLLAQVSQESTENTKFTVYSSEEVALLTKEKELQSIRIQQNQLKLQQKQTIQYSLFLGVFMLLVVALVLFQQNKIRKKINLALKQKNKEIASFHKKLTHSIQYAKRIQEAILPSLERIEKAFQDSFILYLPKDIVSGDFYWFAEVEGKKIIALGDCTGHGVPGAFMTMLGTSILNYTIVERTIIDPEIVLKKLDKYLRDTLDDGQETKSNDGMDIGICTIDTENQCIDFAAAKLSLYRISHGELIRYKGSTHPIGDTRIKTEKNFPVEQVRYEKGDIIYLISDGYQDQFGGEENRKFMSQQLRELLISIHELPTVKQKEILFQKFEDWKGTNHQTDDICVLGIRL
jgi:serine phosphatase RsbU (regulator of sigma subunit)